MTNNRKPPENTGDAAPEDAAQELLEHRDLQNAQINSMRHVWDNPEDEAWNNPEIPGWEVDAAEQFRPVRNSNETTGSKP